MSEFRHITEVVLYNECGCELDRREIINDNYHEIISSWVLYPNDRIEIVERETEQY